MKVNIMGDWSDGQWWALVDWLVFLGRLSAKDRLANWGMAVDKRRLLCQLAEESHEHLLSEMVSIKTICSTEFKELMSVFSGGLEVALVKQ